MGLAEQKKRLINGEVSLLFIRSEITDSSNKIVWFILVFFLPLLGMILYQFIGTGQKKTWISPQAKSQKESLTRLYPDKSKEGEFTIM